MVRAQQEQGQRQGQQQGRKMPLPQDLLKQAKAMPTPMTADGHPDLSGTWNGLGDPLVGSRNQLSNAGIEVAADSTEDIYTGAVIAITVPGNVPSLVWQVWGGTSVACPMFSALWAIANQESVSNGGPALGLAAAHVYSLPAGSVFDVVPVGSKTNVTASIVDSGGTTAYTAAQILGGPTPNPPGKFVSAIWDYASFQSTALVISFGTDCAIPSPSFFYDGTTCNSPAALHTKKGWDNVTGVGTPNAQAFADAFKPAVK